jgi:hypothetical protein
VRLKKLLARPGGIAVNIALSRAEDNLQAIRSACLAGVDEKIRIIRTLAAADDPKGYETCYRLANEVFAEAGAFGQRELSAAALSLCELLSAPDRSSLPAEAVRVHGDAMRSLRVRMVAENEALRAAVIEDLRAMTARIVARAERGR